MTATWQRVEAADIDVLQALFLAVRLPEFLAGGLPEPMARTLLKQQYHVRSRAYAASYPDLEIWHLLLDGTPIGAMQLASTAAGLCLVDIAILPEHQGRGLGGAALRALQSRAADERRSLHLSVRRNNPARRLYARLGFVEQPAAPDTLDLALHWSPP